MLPDSNSDDQLPDSESSDDEPAPTHGRRRVVTGSRRPPAPSTTSSSPPPAPRTSKRARAETTSSSASGSANNKRGCTTPTRVTAQRAANVSGAAVAGQALSPDRNGSCAQHYVADAEDKQFLARLNVGNSDQSSWSVGVILLEAFMNCMNRSNFEMWEVRGMRDAIFGHY